MISTWVLVGLAGLVLIADLRVDTTIGSALNRTGERWQTYQRSMSQHGGDEFVAVVLPAREPFDAVGLTRVLELTEALAAIEGVRRVDSLATVPLIREGDDGAVMVGPALNEETTKDATSRERLAAQIREDLIAPGNLVSADERTLALNVVFEGDVDGDRESTVAAIRKACSRIPGTILSGVPVVRADAGLRTRVELAIFVPLTVCLVSMLLWLLFRQSVAVFVPLVVGALGCVFSLGVMAASGVSLSFATSLLPSVVLALSCAYSMHVLWVAQDQVGSGGLGAAVAGVAQSIAVSGATTALGFLAMASVGVDLIRDLATYGALSVLVVNAASLSLAPAILSVWPIKTPVVGILQWWSVDRASRSLVRFVARFRPVLLGAWLVIFGLSSVGLGRLTVASDVILWFPADSELRVEYEGVRSRLSGITPVNILVEGSSEFPVTDLAVLGTVNDLVGMLREMPQVGKVVSLADPISQMHQVVGQMGKPALPDDQLLVEQYLLLLEGIEQIDDLLTEDRTSSNILIRMDNNSSSEIVALASHVEEWWQARQPPGVTARATGIMFEFGRAQDAIAYGGLRGLALAVGTIGLVLLVVFRGLGLALLSLIPNLVPVGIAFGVVGLIGAPLDAATVCVASLALGIGVDDTVHVVARFQQARSTGLAVSKSLEDCFRHVLGALVCTTVVVAVGFSILGLSEFTLVRNLGLMTAGVVLLCLLADLVLLPVILTGFDSLRKQHL